MPKHIRPTGCCAFVLTTASALSYHWISSGTGGAVMNVDDSVSVNS